MRMKWDETARKFFADRGYRIRDDGIVVLTKLQWQHEESIGYTGVSIRDNVTKTWVIPYCTLIMEGKHFVIE